MSRGAFVTLGADSEYDATQGGWMRDSEATAEARRRQQTTEGWIAWLRDMRWEYYANGTFQRAVSAPTALIVATNLLAPYLPAVYAAVGVQRGPAHDKYHVHMVIGGISRTPRVASALRASWVKRGYLALDGYHHLQRGIEYLVNQAEEIEIIGTPKLFRAS